MSTMLSKQEEELEQLLINKFGFFSIKLFKWFPTEIQGYPHRIKPQGRPETRIN